METETNSNFYKRRGKLVEARWKELLPALTHFTRSLYFPEPKEALEHLREVFLARIQYLLETGVRWKAIRDRRLDWPLTRDESFLKLVQDFRARSARYGSHLRHPSHSSGYGQDFEKRYNAEEKRK